MRPSFPALPFAAAALAAAVSTVAPAASAQQLRYTGTAPGNVVATGNTLGLSKELNANGPGIRDSIGTFLTLGATIDNVPANPANPWPMGTTFDWTQNGSAAVLTLPSETSVLYAELLWGGSYQYGDEDVTAALGSLITLESDNATLAVAPDPATALTENSTAASGFAVRYYMRSANVTPFVKSHGAGTYRVKGVPATQTSLINSLNAAGWTLVVAYRDETAPTRNLSVFVGGSFVDEDSQQDYTVSGFCAPPAGAVTGTAIVSAVEGDANLTGDQLLIAPTAAGPFVQLAGPNNPANNFFCSQLNDKNGNLDPQGTFGDKNQDAVAGVNIAGGRQGWDVTTVPLSSQAGQLVNGQTTAVLRTITTGDSYMPILASFAIDVNAPKVAGQNNQLTAMPDTVMLGDNYTLTATLKNTGQLAAQELLFKLPPPAGVSLVSFKSDGVSGDINGQAVSAATLTNGVPEGTLSSGQTRVVSVVFHVDADPQSALLYHFATWGYGFQACVGAPLLHESVSRSATVSFTAGGSGGAGGAMGGAGGAMGGAGGAMGGSNTGGATGGVGAGGATGGSVQGGAGGSGGSGGSTGGATGGANTGGASGGSAAGGAGAAGGGAGGDAGEAGAGGRVIETGGCSCRTTDDEPSPTGALLSVVALAALLSRGRRRDRRGAGSAV